MVTGRVVEVARGSARAAFANQGSNGSPVAQTQSVAAPVGGLNASSAIAAMAPTDCVICDNWFPQPSFVSLRNGYEQWKTGFSAWVETLMGYTGLDSAEHLFAISGTSVYDATAQGAIGSAVVTGLTNARWEYTDVAVPGGAYLYAANGLDAPLLYSGSAWVKVTGISTPAITGVTTTTLRNPTVWKSRVWFVQTTTNLAWYLPVQSIGGAAHSVDLSTIFTLGGALQSIMTFSVSSTTSFDDYIGFLSTEGQLAVYTGTDPDTPGLFNIVGVYNVGKPIGRRCWFKNGSDAVIITSNGFVSVTKAIAVGVQEPESAISYKILAAVNDAVTLYRSNFGWQGVVYPIGNKIIMNVPVNENASQFQFVMNTINKSWCTFGAIASPWNAATFCVLGDNLYFGGSTYVGLADVGHSDADANINGSIVPAYSYFGSDKQKEFTMVRPLLQSEGNINPALSLCVDFQNTLPTSIPSFSGGGGSPWNTSPWNISPWSIEPTIQKDWQTVGGVGFAATIYLTVSANDVQVNLMAIDYLYKSGGVL